MLYNYFMKLLNKLITSALILCLLTGCANTKTYISYSVYPIGYLLSRIGGNKIQTISVQTDDMIQLATVKEMTEESEGFNEILDNSQYFLHIGTLEPYLDIYEDEMYDSGSNIIDLSTLNTTYKFKRYTLVRSNNVDTYIESPYYEGEEFNVLDTYNNDLFLWLDPIGMLSMANDVYDLLSSNYVEQSAYFKANYDVLHSDLITLDATYQTLANKCKANNVSIKFVSMTPSFGSWQKSYGFQVYPICLSKYGTLPTDEQLEIIKQRIVDDGVKYIAYEPNMSNEMTILFNQLVDDLDLTRVNLSNISSLTNNQKDNGKDYLTLMYENYNVLEMIYNDLITDYNLIED